MGEPILLLRLEGPLQSWGVRAQWDVRDSAREPTKAGVIGLVGAALGYERDDDRLALELDAGLHMGVRVEREPELLDDYHTITGFLPIAAGGFKHSGVRTAKKLDALLSAPDVEPATIESRRRYLADGAFLVALAATGHAPPGLLARCADALRRPYWPLYLGRRACVATRPIFEALTDAYEDVEDALRRHPWSCLGGDAAPRRDGPPARLRVVSETMNGAPRDDVRRARTRTYGRRHVRELMITPPTGA